MWIGRCRQHRLARPIHDAPWGDGVLPRGEKLNVHAEWRTQMGSDTTAPNRDAEDLGVEARHPELQREAPMAFAAKPLDVDGASSTRPLHGDRSGRY